MKVTTPRPAIHFAASPADATALLTFLAVYGLRGEADTNVRPRVTVAGCSQERLNELCWEFARARWEALNTATETFLEGSDLR